MTRSLLSACLVLLVTGCDDIEQFAPDVQFSQFDVQSIDFEGAEVDFVFEVANPNPIRISLASFSYEFDLAESNLLSGDNPNGFELRALDSSTLALPISLNWVETWNAAQAVRGEDEVAFGLRGDMGFNIPLERFEGQQVRLPFQEAGNFPAVRTPKFRLGKLKVINLDLLSQTANVELEFHADNDHGSTLFFDSFDYVVHLAGNPVGTGLLGSLGDVPGAQEGRFVLPIAVDLFELGDAGWQTLVNREPIDARLTADMDVDTPFGLLPLSINERGNIAVQ